VYGTRRKLVFPTARPSMSWVRYQDIADTFFRGMPWKDLRSMSQKLEFVEKAAAVGANVAALCREYGISRQTGHKWIRRYRAQGYLGLVEQSRRPSSTPLATGEEIVVSILELKDRHPSYGPKKISLVLARKLGPIAPSRTTIARVLRRLGKVKKRRPACSSRARRLPAWPSSP
jgi:transposase-like protein